MSVFDDPHLIMEAAKWRSAFADFCVESSKTQFFSNFGSRFEKREPDIDYEALLTSISNRLATDLLIAIKQDASQIPQRSKTATIIRDGKMPRGRGQGPRTPLVTPNQSRRPANNNNNPVSSKVRFLAPLS